MTLPFFHPVKVILYHPQIPQNAGNIVRTCSVTGCDLILVKPLGFSVQDRWLKRAGLDYWEGVNVQCIDDLVEFLNQTKAPLHFFSSKAAKLYTEVSYQTDSILIFGSETSGLPLEILRQWEERFVTIPMLPSKRCLNLATSVGIGVYEALRQTTLAC
jgi:tRNA (cytidine/uridine-2'-O-)-methyltransferase